MFIRVIENSGISKV